MRETAFVFLRRASAKPCLLVRMFGEVVNFGDCVSSGTILFAMRECRCRGFGGDLMAGMLLGKKPTVLRFKGENLRRGGVKV